MSFGFIWKTLELHISEKIKRSPLLQQDNQSNHLYQGQIDQSQRRFVVQSPRQKLLLNQGIFYGLDTFFHTLINYHHFIFY